MDVIKVSFTKENVLKAIKQINSHKNNHDCILDECVDDEEYIEDSYIDVVNEAMCTDKLIDYLNRNCKSGLRSVKFGEPKNLGFLGECINAAEEFYKEHDTSHDYGRFTDCKITDSKICLVGYTVESSGVYGNYYAVSNATETYITEEGDVLTVSVVSYGIYFKGDKVPEILLETFTVSKDETPIMNAIDELFPEKYQGLYDF